MSRFFGNRGSTLALAVLSFTLITLSVIPALQSQEVTQKGLHTNESQFPIVDEADLVLDVKEREKKELKSRRYKLALPVTSNPNFQVAAAIHHWPEDFSPLPVAVSTTILVGQVKQAKANLSADRRAVFTDFTISPSRVLKDSSELVKENLPLIASRYGGRVRFPDGHTQWIFKTGLGMPLVGKSYVFFLTVTDADFDLVTAYELSEGKVQPLDGGTPNFELYRNQDQSKFIKEIQERISSRLRIASH